MITVLIPAHNEAEVLRECLDAVLAQTLPVDEIVVVADSCTDDTVAVAESYGAVVVETEQGGKAASQDVGLAYVTGDILVCIDADTVIDVDVVEKFMAELAAGADATCANMLPMRSACSSRTGSALAPRRRRRAGYSGSSRCRASTRRG